jgi:hypothetical protein
MVKNSKFVNVQHVLEIVELDAFDTKQTKVVERQLLKHQKRTLISLEEFKEEDKQANPIEIHEKDNPTSPKKSHGRPLG